MELASGERILKTDFCSLSSEPTEVKDSLDDSLHVPLFIEAVFGTRGSEVMDRPEPLEHSEESKTRNTRDRGDTEFVRKYDRESVDEVKEDALGRFVLYKLRFSSPTAFNEL